MSKSSSFNNNFKVCARIKPLEYSSRMLETSSDNSVTINDINNRTTTEKQVFHFNKVFDQYSQQDSVFQYILDNGINKAIEGTNCCVFSYGQTGAGKTYSIFGDDERYSPNSINLYSDTRKDKQGLIPKTVEYLLKKNKETAGVRELILTCNFVEMYLDQVRDLGRTYVDKHAIGSPKKKTYSGDFNMTAFENENLEIYEHANGQMLIRNVKNFVIKSMEELYEFLASGFRIREKVESKGNQIWERAHTIFTISIVQKEVEDEDLPFPKSMIQFVDLAGSERIAKTITEGQQKYQEAVMIMAQLTSLYKVLSAVASNSKIIPYRDSKLTKLLYNCLNPYHNIIMIAHLHPAESSFEETLNTLQYAERCKNIDFKSKGIGSSARMGNVEESGLFPAGAGNQNEKIWKKMNEEIAELKAKLDTTVKDYKLKLERIQTYLGVKVDLNKISGNVMSKEAQALMYLKNVCLENENLKVTVAQTDCELQELKREVEDERREFYARNTKTQGKLIEVSEKTKKDSDKFKTERTKEEENYKKQIQQLNAENKKLIQNNKQLMEEKTSAIMNFNAQLQAKTRDLNQNTEMKNMGRKEAETQYREEVDQLKADHKKIQDSLKEQYEHWLKLKNDEMDAFAQKGKEYKIKKKEKISQMETELLELHSIIQKQEKLIEKVESGGFSNGIRSFNIPAKEKCQPTTRQKFPELYKVLDDKKKSEASTRSLFRDEEAKTDDKNGNAGLRKSIGFSVSKSHAKFSSPLLQASASSSSMLVKSMDKSKEKEAEPDVDLDININMLQPEDLKRYVDNLKKHCKGLKEKEKTLKVQADKFVELNVYGDIHQIIKEREHYKHMYKEEVKRNNDNKITIESQKRQLKSPQKLSSLANMRPKTSGLQ